MIGWKILTDFVYKPYKYKIKHEKIVKPKKKIYRLEDRIDFNMKIEKKNIEIIF